MMHPEIEHVFNESALKQISKMRRRIGANRTDELLLAQFKLIDENKAEISRLRYMVGRLQDKLREAVSYNNSLQYEDTLKWGLKSDMEDVGPPDQEWLERNLDRT